MRIARQLLFGALAFWRFTVADGDDDEYGILGNTGANNQTGTPHVREGNHTVHFVTVGNDTNNFYVQLSSSTARLNHANYRRSRTVFALNQEM